MANFEPYTVEEAILIKNLAGTSQLQLLAITVPMDLDKLKAELFDLNLDKLILRWEESLPGPPGPPSYPQEEYSIRLDGSSPKDGIRGAGPHSSVRSMLVGIASSERGTAYLNRYAPAPEELVKPPAKKGKKKKKEPEEPQEMQIFYTNFPGMLWIFPHDSLREEAWEFRCFVHGQKLRAVSQRAWDRDLRGEGVKWAQPTEVDVWATAITKAACDLVQRFCFGEPKPELEPEPPSALMMTSFQRARRDTEIAKLVEEEPEESTLPHHFTLDVLVRMNEVHGMPAHGTKHETVAVAGCSATLEAVQVKPFGAQFDVGSATYHWVNDYKTLVHGMKQGNAIEFRFIADVEPVKPTDYAMETTMSF